MNVDLNALPQTVLTAEEASELEQRLNAIRNSLFQTANGGTQVFKNTLSNAEYEHISSYAQKHSITMDDPTAAGEFLNALTIRLSELPLLTVRVAFRARRSFAEQITEWLAEHGPGPARVQFVYDPGIVGGIVIEYEGQIHDYSIQQEVERHAQTLVTR